ncbi:hypothetical protein PCASD_05877 [Puccinia coronata f. sp. avenae]|uniref:Uncharacterized protein n=1 Tax=Puccinia coronata f. sp. avenae TaxID=200324 RepID=A0A2N5V3Y0_9BASI|nr:hypothetical protein PCASD_05877 [Puccinia coronata f. sp. avenae]
MISRFIYICALHLRIDLIHSHPNEVHPFQLVLFIVGFLHLKGTKRALLVYTIDLVFILNATCIFFIHYWTELINILIYQS